MYIDLMIVGTLRLFKTVEVETAAELENAVDQFENGVGVLWFEDERKAADYTTFYFNGGAMLDTGGGYESYASYKWDVMGDEVTEMVTDYEAHKVFARNLERALADIDDAYWDYKNAVGREGLDRLKNRARRLRCLLENLLEQMPED